MDLKALKSSKNDKFQTLLKSPEAGRERKLLKPTNCNIARPAEVPSSTQMLKFKIRRSKK